jgi:PAS domain S-box-containing protein
VSAPASFDPPTEEGLREFVDLSLNLVCITGTDGYFKYVNPAWETTFGYRRNELLSAPYLEFVHPDDRKATVAQATHSASGESTVSFETATVARTGPTNGYSGRVLCAAKKG